MKEILSYLIVLLLAVILLGIIIIKETPKEPLERQLEPSTDALIMVMGNSIQATRVPNQLGTRKVIGEVTVYNNHINQTWGDPNIMASGKRVYEGAIACPVWLSFGTLVEIDGEIYVCEDRMAPRYRHGNYFDLFSYSYEQAINYGRQTKEITIYGVYR